MKEQRTIHINDEAIDYTVTNERDDGRDLGYYGTSKRQGGRGYGVTGPWPTESEAAPADIAALLAEVERLRAALDQAPPKGYQCPRCRNWNSPICDCGYDPRG